jgi:hypothetical protein
MVDEVSIDAMLWAQALTQASDTIHTFDDTLHTFNEMWNTWQDKYGRMPPRPSWWRDQLRGYLGRGLNGDDVEELMEVTMSASQVTFDKKWIYFGGCCKQRLADIEDLAHKLYSQEV